MIAPNEHVLHYLMERAAKDDSVIRFMDRKEQYTELRYPELWEMIKTYAGYYQSIGVKPGEVISLMLLTCQEYIAAFFGAQLIKAIPVSLYPPQSLAKMDEWLKRTALMIESVRSKNLVTNTTIKAVAKDLRDHIDINFLVTDIINHTGLQPSYDIESFKSDDICFLQFSSGTTGCPKAVIISQENALSNVNVISKALPLENHEMKAVSWLPLYHDMGLVGTLLASIVQGNELTLIRPDDFIRKPYLWLKAIHDYKLNITTAPNFAYGLVQKRVKAEKIAELDLSSMRVALCGAEMVYRETMEKFVKHLEPAGFPAKSLVPVYGMAEATLAVSFCEFDRDLNFIKVDKKKLEQGKVKFCENGFEICSVGKLLSTFSMKIVNSKNKEVGPGEIGRILIKGPSITKGYFLDPEKTAASFIDGWLDTGDEGFIFYDELFICGRLKDTIIIRGKNYYPTAFEEKLYQINGLRKGRVIVSSVFNKKSETEEVVVLAEASSAKLEPGIKEELKSKIQSVILNESLPLMAVEIVPPGTLLRTSSGKLKRRQTVNSWKKGDLKATERVKFRRQLSMMVKLISSHTKKRLKQIAG